MVSKEKAAAMVQPSHPRRGLALASLVIPVGIVAWVILWQFGFIASIVSWGIAAGAVWLYKIGAAREVTKTVAPYLLAIIVLGVVLSFLGGVVSDGWVAYRSNEIGGKGSIVSGDFLSFLSDNLASAELWQGYVTDILVAVAFAALGVGGVVYGLFKDQAPEGQSEIK